MNVNVNVVNKTLDVSKKDNKVKKGKKNLIIEGDEDVDIEDEDEDVEEVEEEDEDVEEVEEEDIEDVEDFDTTYNSFYENSIQFQENEHYKSLMCLKDTTSGPKHDKSKDEFMDNKNKMSGRDNLKCKCVLPLGHKGKCCKNFSLLFKNNKITKKLISSSDLAIYSTPGNDDYVYKNRCSRLYRNVLSSREEKKIRDKKNKKKCAIPLKDTSFPILLAQAYLDWITYIVNIKDISELLNIEENANNDILLMISKNKEHLISVFENYNRQVFDNYGNSICVITKNIIEVSDVSDPTRNNRINILDKDIQLGHNYPRSEKYVSIRGENLIPMSRRGNLVIGERIFTQDIWINELKQIVSSY